MNKVTINTIQKLKDEGKKIAMLTAYDYSTAKYVDEAGMDMILVGDSLAMVVLGYESTNFIGMEEMTIFTKAVSRGAKNALIVADMPFISYQTDISNAVKNAGELIKSGAGAVKLEGGSKYILDVVQRCTESGIPVMGHLGFTPQSVNTIGGYRVQGKSYEKTQELLKQSQDLEKAGAFAIVLEMVPEESAKYITDNINIPTIGIGAGRYCSGQVLVSDDAFGKYSDFTPKFARKYGDLRFLIKDFASQYVNDVKEGKFPSKEETFNLPQDELEKLGISVLG